MMQRVEIGSRLRPFSHQPGAKCLIPGTPYLVEVFPALVRIREFSNSLEMIKELPLPITQGPLKQFTVVQDLEKGCVTAYSEHYLVHILPNLEFSFAKHPPLPTLPSPERLSLGSHKKMDVDRIRRRRDLLAFLPFWFRLGSLLKLPARMGDNRGIFKLLIVCSEAIGVHRPERILHTFERLYLAGMSAFLVPRFFDEEMQGILPRDSPLSEDSPLYILSEGAALIRSLFILSSGNQISILPNLPPECFSGRMTNLIVPSWGKIDLEWSQKTIRKLCFYAEQEGEITFHFPPHMASYRLRCHAQERPSFLRCGDSLEVKAGVHYLLDRFQK
jgi:hypothetical protein